MKKITKIFCLIINFSLVTTPVTLAETKKPTSSDSCNEIAAKDLLIKNPNKITSYSSDEKIIASGLQLPSLWWTKEQFDPFGGRLINNWFTYPEKKQINLVVNWQLWTLLDYLGRYRFVHNFGTVVRQYGYNLHVFNQQQQCLATYEYNRHSNPPKWEINLDGEERESLQFEPVTNSNLKN
jgi:hypothetical protein